MVAPFEEATGYEVIVSTTRDLKGALERSIAAGDPPDLAGLPGPGYMDELASQGHLVDLGNVIDTGKYKRETAPGFVSLGTVDGRLVGVFIKGTVKGLFWYDPDVFRPGALTSWSALQIEATRAVPGVRPWCIGLASEASSGWPGTDWVEDFVLRQSGPDFYDDWVAGRVKWTSPEIRWAFQSFGTVIADSAVCRRRRRCAPDALQPRRRRAVHRPADLPARAPGHVHVDVPRRGHREVRRHVRLRAVPRHGPALPGRAHRGRRPLRDDARHAGRRARS